MSELTQANLGRARSVARARAFSLRSSQPAIRAEHKFEIVRTAVL